MGEHLPCKQGVKGSNPFISTIKERSLKKWNKPGNGGVAQLGEHLPCKQGVKGSIPFISTRQRRLSESN